MLCVRFEIFWGGGMEEKEIFLKKRGVFYRWAVSYAETECIKQWFDRCVAKVSLILRQR